MVPLFHQPQTQRPRERLQRYGVEHLSVQELVCLIIGSGGKNNRIHTLAEHIANVVQRPSFHLQDLLNVPGIGMARAASLMAALQLPQAVKQDQNAQLALTNPEKLYAACEDLLEKAQEHLVIFYLSSRCTVIQREVISVGTATASLVHPREVFRAAMQHNASAIALAHNHPSGNAEPSEADLIATQTIATAGSIVGIELVDHLVCSVRGYTSLKMDSPQLFCYAKPI